MDIQKLGMLALLWLTVGCGAETPPDQRAVFPTMGAVSFKGEPIPDATICLHPVVPPADGKPVFVSRGKVDENGLFAVSTYAREDGAPAGEYRVSVSWEGPLNGLSEDEQDRLKERLPRKYTSPESSGITVVISEETNVLDEIVIN